MPARRKPKNQVYVLERDRKPEMPSLKACTRCGVSLANTFRNFKRVPVGPRKFGWYNTAEVCRKCLGTAVSEGIAQARPGVEISKLEDESRFQQVAELARLVASSGVRPRQDDESDPRDGGPGNASPAKEDEDG